MLKKMLVGGMAFAFVAMVASTASAQSTASDPQGAATPAAFGAGVLKKFQSVSATNQLSTTNVFLTVASDTVTLTTPGCIVTTVDGEVAMIGTPDGGISMLSQILIDGVLAEGQVSFYSPDNNGAGRFEVEGHHAWRCGLGVGNHGIVWRVASEVAGNTTFVRARNMTSQFKK